MPEERTTPSPKRPLPLQYVKGIGPKRAEALAKEEIVTPGDVLRRVPRGYVERSAVPTITALFDRIRTPSIWKPDAPTPELVTGEISLIATVVDVAEKTVGRGRSMLTATVADSSPKTARLVFWNAIGYFKKVLQPGATFVVSGLPEYDSRWNQLTFSHPELERIDAEEIASFEGGGVLPKYPMTQGLRNAGITMRLMRSLVEQVIDEALSEVHEILPESLLKRHGLMDRQTAFRELHFPTSMQAVEMARRRMKFEELFEFQLFLATRNRSRKSPERGLKMDAKSPHARALVERLPFELTAAQRRVIHEIMHDMTDGIPMNRLLQGDVGSGKTIVALLCMLNVVDNGYQAVIMAPTEILAEQHYRGITRWLADSGIEVVQLVGGLSKKARTEARSRIASGEARIIVGTHALFEGDVEYDRLGLIVIDEQHRFGVAQRAELRRLGKRSHADEERTPHILVMSATPIPRTLSMTLYGDLDVSVIDELPKDRIPIRTQIVFESNLPNTYQFIREQIREGRQAYVVFPLVEKSDKLELKSAVEHHAFLQEEVFPDLKVGLLHGQMLAYEKDDTMQAFLDRAYDVLVATTVIEVGVDVPNATVMLIENAERFGLSQLHQLRGRVGRGAHRSYCFLATKDHFRYHVRRKTEAEDGAKAAVRLRTLEDTTDGFKIAEVDLRLRGPGDLMGTRQSGVPEFSFADLVEDGDIVRLARQDAFDLIADDPHLRKQEHAALRQRLIAAFESGTYQTVA